MMKTRKKKEEVQKKYDHVLIIIKSAAIKRAAIKSAAIKGAAIT